MNTNDKKNNAKKVYGNKTNKPMHRKKIIRRKPLAFDRRANKGTYEANFKLMDARKKNESIVDDEIRVLTIGGFEEVGRNMFAVESKDSIYIFDMGFEFTSEDDAPGIDYTLPNIKYLRDHKEKIKAIIITHGHLDHIGGIPFIIGDLGNPPIYTQELTAYLIKKKMEDYPLAPKIKINLVEPGDQIKIGEFSFEFFEVTHSIPDSMGVSVKTKHGNIVISGDLKLAHENGKPIQRELDTWKRIASQDNTLLILDSTNCENAGWSVQEIDVIKNIEKIIQNAPSRIIIATFASQFARMMSFIEIAEKMGKKIVLEGRSVKTNMEIAKLANYYTPNKDTIIPATEIHNYPADKIVIICTGGQGEEFAALPRIARGDHKYIKLTKRDTIILSSSVIPGNEISVRNLKDALMRNDIKLYHYKTSEVHSTGHGNAEELAWIIRQVNPKYFVPGYGFHSMLKEHKRIAKEIAGFPEENIIVPDNGSVLEISKGGKIEVLPHKVPSSPVLVDGYSISDMKKTVISDRKLLSKDGFINVIVLINVRQKKLQKSPDILSRGFIYLRESQALLNGTRKIITDTVNQELKVLKSGKVDVDIVKEKIYEKLEGFLLKKTNKKPIIIPVVLVV